MTGFSHRVDEAWQRPRQFVRSLAAGFVVLLVQTTGLLRLAQPMQRLGHWNALGVAGIPATAVAPGCAATWVIHSAWHCQVSA
ncbi:hypothetical protein LMG919_15565 [Xanthomonas vesicatoria]|nr:hypothetical protein LMG919_15565 [Xanthomonas vesicatoria]